MKTKIAFLLIGKKGFKTLEDFVLLEGAENINFVVASRDPGVDNDFYDEIVSSCQKNNIVFYDRLNFDKRDQYFENLYVFAIGWKWVVKNFGKLIVLHDSLLPKYRGFAPLVNMLINKEPFIGATALIANESYDTGDIISQKKIAINYPIKISSAINYLIPIYCELVQEVYLYIQNGCIEDKKIKQDDKLASYSLWRDQDDYFIDWNRDADYISRFCDSVGAPYDGAKFYVKDEVYRLLDAEKVDDLTVENRLEHVGKVIFMDQNSPVIICGKGLLKLCHFEKVSGLAGQSKIPFRSRLR